MKTLDATVNWMYRWGNPPCLFLLVDKMPPAGEARYQFKQEGKGKDHGLYFSEHEGYVKFYFYHGIDRGFGGRTFNLTLVDGGEVALTGPWSSRPACMNSAGFPTCTDVTITDDKEVWQRGHTFIAGNILLSVAQEAIEKFCPHVKMGARDAHGETVYYPIWSDEKDKPPTPEKDDPRWDGHRMWPTGINGSELYKPEGRTMKIPDAKEVWKNKSPEIVKFLNNMSPFDPRQGVCAMCGTEILGFNDELSRREWGISGMCQGCQDKVFG